MHQDDPQWDGRERRETRGRRSLPEAETHILISETREMVLKQEERIHQVSGEVKEVSGKIDRMHSDHMAALTQQNNTIGEIHKLFKAAFPYGNVEEHRMKHIAWEKKEQEDREFWIKLKQNTINWVVVAVIGWGGLALWAAFLQGPK